MIVKLKLKQFSIIILGLMLLNFLTSCTDEEEYIANVTVINNSDTIVNDFCLNGKGTDFSKTISTIDTVNVNKFDVKWIGKTSALFGSKDNSYIFLSINYEIGSKEFNVQNEKDAKIDSYGNYYSEKQVTNGTNIKILINNDNYEIEYIE